MIFMIFKGGKNPHISSHTFTGVILPVWFNIITFFEKYLVVKKDNITHLSISKNYEDWGNWQFGLGIQNEAGQRLTEFWQENLLVIANTIFQQHKRWLYTWTSPVGQDRNQIDYILCSWRWWSSIQSAKTRPGADGGSDHAFLIAKFRLKLNKVRKATRQFMYELNQIPYNYTVEMTNRVKGLDLIECLKKYRWRFMILYRRQR